MNFDSATLRRRTQAFAILTALTVATAGAASVHPLGVTQTTGSGGSDAFLNTSASGSALQGEVGSSANTSIAIPFGLFGEYNAPGSTFGVGVIGISTTGYGIAAEALSAQPTILALAGSTGDGLDAYTSSSSSGAAAVYADAQGALGPALYGAALGGEGVYGFSSTGTAVIGSTPGAGGVGSLGAPGGEGVMAYGYSGNAAHPSLATFEEAPGSDAIGSYLLTSGTQYERFIVQGGTANGSGESLPNGMDVQQSADVYTFGLLYENCSLFPATSPADCDEVGTVARARTAENRVVRMYTPRQSARTSEDFGNAQLVNGDAYVALDPTFAKTISKTSPYLVFLTPAGDSRGLFVAHRTPMGFEVRENGGGRSTLAFDYRIVAKPYGDASPRLAYESKKNMQTTAAAVGVPQTKPALLAHLNAPRPHAVPQLLTTRVAAPGSR